MNRHLVAVRIPRATTVLVVGFAVISEGSDKTYTVVPRAMPAALRSRLRFHGLRVMIPVLCALGKTPRTPNEHG